MSYRFFIVTMMRNDYSAAAIHEFLVNAWHEQSPSLVTVYRIMREVKDGARTSFEDSVRSGRPNSAANDVCV